MSISLSITICTTPGDRGIPLESASSKVSRISLDWAGPPPADVEARLIGRVASLVREEGHALPGVASALALAREGGRRVALASSSPLVIIHATLERLGLDGAFDVVQSAQSLPLGKPHPGIFLRTAELLSVSAVDCVVLEDSLIGVIAAKAARMSWNQGGLRAGPTSGRYSSLFGEFGAQNAPEHFPGVGRRKLVAKDHGVGTTAGTEMQHDEIGESLRRGRDSVVGHDHRGDHLAPFVVWQAEDADLLHFRVEEHDIFDLPG